MEIIIAAVGKIKTSPLLDLINHYAKDCGWRLVFKEVLEKRKLPIMENKKAEAALLLDAVAGVQVIVALDERGNEFSSLEFAQNMKRWEEIGSLAFIIGGADGLDDSVRQHSDIIMSFGKMTWPHFLVRLMLIEQLYRARRIINNHPYHRE